MRASLLQGKENKILVLDDFLTSLDASNRTFLLKFIFEEFSEFQVLIFTHNISFFNLGMYMCNDVFKSNDQWIFANVYELNNKSHLYQKRTIDRVSSLKTAYIESPTNLEEIGNRIRKRFEVLLYEYSKLVMIGAIEDSKKILERIEHRKRIFFKGNNKTASNLVDEIIDIIEPENNTNLSQRIKSKISEYDRDIFPELRKTVLDLKLFQKVSLHPLSHGTVGYVTFTRTEINHSLDLLEKLEKRLKDLVGSDVNTV